jgi:hypothetical protein
VTAFDPEVILRVLAHHRVRYILVGATAARLQGFPRLTADADITPALDPDNLRCLASALRALNAKIYTESVPAPAWPLILALRESVLHKPDIGTG